MIVIFHSGADFMCWLGASRMLLHYSFHSLSLVDLCATFISYLLCYDWAVTTIEFGGVGLPELIQWLGIFLRLYVNLDRFCAEGCCIWIKGCCWAFWQGGILLTHIPRRFQSLQPRDLVYLGRFWSWAHYVPEEKTYYFKTCCFFLLFRILASTPSLLISLPCSPLFLQGAPNWSSGSGGLGRLPHYSPFSGGFWAFKGFDWVPTRWYWSCLQS